MRAGVTIDCARSEEANRGMQDSDWWLNLYVMFSRTARMQDMLLLRPPPRAFLEKGPPDGVRAALARFAARKEMCHRDAEHLANKFHIPLTG